MKRGRVAAAVAVGALATTGTAPAAQGGGPVKGIFGGEKHGHQFANHLAGELGISQSKVHQALENVQDQQRSEQTLAFAQVLAAQLDGTSVEDIVKVLDEEQGRIEEQMRSGKMPPEPKRGEKPNPEDSPLVAALADGLGKSKAEIADALVAAGRAGGPGGLPPIGIGVPGPGGPGGGPGGPGGPGGFRAH